MKVYCKKLAAAMMVVCMALGMTACGSKPLDGSQIVATVGEKEMTLGEANFLLRYQQVQTEPAAEQTQTPEDNESGKEPVADDSTGQE